MRLMRAAIETVPLVAGHLDQIAAGEGSHRRCRFVHQGAKIGSLDLPALGQLADHELGIGVDEEAVGRRGPGRPLDAAVQVVESSDEGLVFGFVVRRRAQI